jgi:hypothetical protein
MPSLDGASPGPTRGSGIGSSSTSAAAAASPGNVYDGSISSSSPFYIPEAPTAPPTTDPYVPPVDMYSAQQQQQQQQQHSTGSTRGSSTSLPSVRNDGKWLVFSM